MREVVEPDEDRVFIVIDWYENGSLQQWIGKPDFPRSEGQPATARKKGPRDRLRWIAENLASVAKAIDHVHHSYFHRDLKPANLLVCKFGHWHVADLGLAKPIEDGDSELTSLAGTPYFLDPALLVAKRAIPHHKAADIYGLGADPLRHANGQPPVRSCENSHQDLRRARERRSYPPARSLRGRRSPGLGENLP